MVTGRTPIKIEVKANIKKIIAKNNTKFDLFFLSTRRMLGYLRVKLHNYYSIDAVKMLVC